MEAERSVKQVIVFRKDLLKGEKSIRKGKFAAQCCHASIGALLSIAEPHEFEKLSSYGKKTHEYVISFMDGDYLDKWMNGTFTKICVGIDNDEELVKLYETIKNNNPDIPVKLITDCGLTEFHGVPTNTCIGVGPYWADEIDKYTGNLKLL